ncbi:DUF3105 domain-containing protein [Salininema proteolyticum]|uniref:DUF3105 domain-containing protein n=1 Tax=Salininema proteolyticum TaxID=1607685 RepID=A0ABV8TT10_9ACTN
MSAKSRNKKVQVEQPKPWGLIITFSVIGVVALGIVGGTLWAVNDSKQPPEGIESFLEDYEYSTELRLALEDGDVEPEDLEHQQVAERTHIEEGAYVDYGTEPPVGGDHYGAWQNCQGRVYDGAVDNRNAVHALEHGAAWIAYDPEQLDQDQVNKLASYVQGRDYSFMSQYPGMDSPISVQAWGLRMPVDSADDERIEQFIDRFSQAKDNTMELNATCSGGVETTVEDPQPEPPAEEDEGGQAAEDEASKEDEAEKEDGQ